MDRLRGSLLASGSALSFGVTIVIGRTLAQAGLGAPTVLGPRFTIAGIILVGVLLMGRVSPFPLPGERLGVVLLGGLGYAAESTLFFMGLERGTVAAVTLLFYAYPALVTLYELATGVTHRRTATLAALALSAAGIVLIVGTGSSLAISGVGIICALGAAAAFAAYLVVSHRIVRRSDAMPVAAWTALGAGASFLLRGLTVDGFGDPSGHWLQLGLNGLATAFAFSLMYAALRLLGPSRTAIVMTLEAFFAVALGAVILGESVSALQAVGGVAMISAAALTARTDPAVASAREPKSVGWLTPPS